jgi:hypothetical protein
VAVNWHYRGVCCLFILLSAISYAEEKNDKAIKLAGVPPGFQFLLEKQTTAIDVFYGDVYLTTTLASYTPTTLEFHNPNEVVDSLDNLLTPEQITMDLSGDVDSHVGEVCYQDKATDCGVLTPESVGIIFDESRFRADVFINPNLLSIQQREMTKYLPASSTNFSNINNLSLLYSGGDFGQEQTALNGQSLFSIGEQRVISGWGYMDSELGGQFSVDTLYWQMDDADVQYQAGWFSSETRYLSFISGLNILGFRYSTSLKARTDLGFTNGSPIQLYLASRSRVNIYKNGKFLSSAFYNPGNQLVDTSTLPDGAYNIELRIIDSAGNEAEVTRFFVKTQRLAPAEQDLYFFEVGDVQEIAYEGGVPKSLHLPIIQAGYSHRIIDSLGLNVGLSSTEDEGVTELGIYYLHDWFDLEPKVLLGFDGEYGWAFNGYSRFYDWSLAYQFRRVWADEQSSPDDFHLVPSWIKQHSLSVGHPLWSGYAQLRYSVSDRASFSKVNEGAAEVTSLTYRKMVGFGTGRYSFYSELTQSNNDSLIVFGVDWSFKNNHTYHTLNADIRHEDLALSGSDDYFRLGYNGSWTDNDLRPEDIAFSWRGNVDDANVALGVDSSMQSYLGSAGLAFNYNDSDVGGDSFLYSGQLATTIAGEDGAWGIGGKNPSQGALIVQVKTDINEKDLAYDILINDMKYGEIKPNQKIVVPVGAYQSYKVTVADKGVHYSSFKQRTQMVTIYPGNVKSLEWESRSVAVLIARVVRKLPGCFDDNSSKCWDPLIHARAKDVNDYAVTDMEGYIQTEVFPAAKKFTLIKKGVTCQVDFSEVVFVDGLGYSENDLQCRELE